MKDYIYFSLWSKSVCLHILLIVFIRHFYFCFFLLSFWISVVSILSKEVFIPVHRHACTQTDRQTNTHTRDNRSRVSRDRWLCLRRRLNGGHPCQTHPGLPQSVSASMHMTMTPPSLPEGPGIKRIWTGVKLIKLECGQSQLSSCIPGLEKICFVRGNNRISPPGAVQKFALAGGLCRVTL